MKIMLAGDSHGDTMYLRQLLHRCEDQGLDLLFVLGDFGYWEHTAEGVHFLDRLDFWAARHDTPIYFLDGNHDKTSLLLEKYGNDVGPDGFLEVRNWISYAPRGLRWEWSGKKFIALGGAYSVDKDWRLDLERKRGKPESLWFPEEEMSDVDMADILAADDSLVHIMLAHDKPRASQPMWNRKDLPGCIHNQQRLQRAAVTLQPELFVHGHLHYRYTDHIQVGDMDYCRVEGLDCNRDTDHGGDGPWMVEDTYLILDLTDDLNRPRSQPIGNTDSDRRGRYLSEEAA